MDSSDDLVVLYRPRRVAVALAGIGLLYLAAGIYLFVVDDGVPMRLLYATVVVIAALMTIGSLVELRTGPRIMLELTPASLRTGFRGKGRAREFAWMDLRSARLTRFLGHQLSFQFASTRIPLRLQRWWFNRPDWETLVQRIRAEAMGRGVHTNF